MKRSTARPSPARPALQRLALLTPLLLTLLTPLAATANIIPSVVSVVGAGPYTWTYRLELSADQDVRSGPLPSGPTVSSSNLSFGSFLTIFDFQGYVAGSCTSPTGWVCVVQNLGYTPSDVLPDDDASVVNLTWHYATGPDISGQPNGVDLGIFSAQSIWGDEGLVSYAGRGIKNTGLSAGTVAANVGKVAGPQGQAVPEPGSLALAGLALVALAGLRKPAQRRRQAKAA
jgi:hypothetical protein